MKKLNLKNKHEDDIFRGGFKAGYEQGVLGALNDLEYQMIDDFSHSHAIDFDDASNEWERIKERIARRLLK